MPTTITPVVTSGAPSVAPSAESYQTSAMAALKTAPGAPNASTAPIVATPPVAAQAPAESITEPEAPEAPKAEPPKVGSDSIKASFERLAKEKSEIRQLKESLRDVEAVSKIFRPEQLRSLAQAAASRDPVAILSAMGFSHADYANAVVTRTQAPPRPGEKKVEPVEEESDDIAVLRRELDEIKAEKQRERIARGRASTVEKLQALAKSGKFELVSEFPDAPHEALAVLEEYVQSTGVVPQGKELEELYDLSLQYVEGRLKEEQARWQGVLTKRNSAPTVPGNEAPEPPRAISVPAAGMTLTNAVTPSGGRPAGTLKNDEDFQAAALEVLRKLR